MKNNAWGDEPEDLDWGTWALEGEDDDDDDDIDFDPDDCIH